MNRRSFISGLSTAPLALAAGCSAVPAGASPTAAKMAVEGISANSIFRVRDQGGVEIASMPASGFWGFALEDGTKLEVSDDQRVTISADQFVIADA